MRSANLTTIGLAMILAAAGVASGAGRPGRAAWQDAVRAVPGARRSVWNGVYTEVQARRGREAYDYSCSTCHLPDLSGDPARDVPALGGEDFVDEWSKQTVGDLYQLVSKQMPKDSPASLSAQTYVDIVAYLLQVNEFPAGAQELPADPAVLARVGIDKTPPAAK